MSPCAPCHTIELLPDDIEMADPPPQPQPAPAAQVPAWASSSDQSTPHAAPSQPKTRASPLSPINEFAADNFFEDLAPSEKVPITPPAQPATTKNRRTCKLENDDLPPPSAPSSLQTPLRAPLHPPPSGTIPCPATRASPTSPKTPQHTLLCSAFPSIRPP
jgi:hypothetical protein